MYYLELRSYHWPVVVMWTSAYLSTIEEISDDLCFVKSGECRTLKYKYKYLITN